MPKPPILPAIDWPAVFAAGLPFAAWLRVGESPANRERIVADARTQPLAPEAETFLRALTRPVHVVAIAEDWCGDVVRHVPVLERLAGVGERLRVSYLARADRPDLFARYLTNGGEAVPKFIFLSDRFVECGNWGPMPAGCRDLIARGKACGDVPAARKLVAAAYAADPGKREVVAELLHLIGISAATAP